MAPALSKPARIKVRRGERGVRADTYVGIGGALKIVCAPTQSVRETGLERRADKSAGPSTVVAVIVRAFHRDFELM